MALCGELTSGELHPCMWRYTIIIKPSIPIRIGHQDCPLISTPHTSARRGLTTPLRKPHPDPIQPAPPRRTDTRHPAHTLGLEVGQGEGLHAAHRGADGGVEAVDAERVEEVELGADLRGSR
jgi:hypothetical protein